MSDSTIPGLQNNVIRVNHQGHAGSLPEIVLKQEVDEVSEQSNYDETSSDRRQYDSGMPATTSANQVPRMQMATAPSFQDFTLLPYQMAAYPVHQGLFLYAGTGFDVLRGSSFAEPPSSSFIKEEQQREEHEEQPLDEQPDVSETDSKSAIETNISIKDSVELSDSYGLNIKREVEVPQVVKKESNRQSDGNFLNVSDITSRSSPSSSTNSTSIVRVANTNFSINENRNSRHTNHAQVLRYPSVNCPETLLCTPTVAGYNDGDIIQESANFNGTLDDSLLSSREAHGDNQGNSGTTLSANYDLFDGNTHESYQGSSEMKLSPHTFSDGSNLSGVTNDQVTDNVQGNGNEGDSVNRSKDNQKLSVLPLLLDRTKSTKSLVGKASSPSRTGAQTCPVCGKVFSNSSALAKHKLTHSDERKYVCQLCTKAFKRQDHLNGHLLTHMNKKPYECKVDGCGKSYCDARSLRRHTENHHSSFVTTNNLISARLQPPPLQLSQVTIPFSVSESVKPTNVTINGTAVSNASIYRLANTLQSNRICYAPPPPPPPLALSTSTPMTTNKSFSSVLQSALSATPLTFRRTPSPNSTPLLITATVTAPTTTMTSSPAANQLQLLAFQQHEQKTGPLPGASLLSWQLQQPPRGNHIGSILDEYLGQSESVLSMAAAAAAATTTTSVLSQHLRTTVRPTTGASSDPARDLSHLHEQQWVANPSSTQHSVVVVKPVECSICQRKFKNTPALNGHMRLHGGYFRKESGDTNNNNSGNEHKHSGARKIGAGRMKTDSQSVTSASNQGHHQPLQTASINIRALIEEKIIQRRIVNPIVNSSSSIPTPPPSLVSSLGTSVDLNQHIDILNYDSDAALRHLQQQQQQLQQQRQQLQRQQEQQQQLQLQQQQEQHQQEQRQQQQHFQHRQAMDLVVDIEQDQHRHGFTSDDEDVKTNLQDHHNLVEQGEYEVREPDTPLPPPPPLSILPTVHHVKTDLYHDQDDPILMSCHVHDEHSEDINDATDDAQSDMQRQIEIIKQGLMAHQHVAEKFRRHSDSDHFLAPRRTPFGPGYNDPDFFSVGALADFFHREKLVGKRMQRTGSDPGEFGVPEMPDDENVNVSDELLPDDVVDAMGVELPDALQIGETLPSADIMDFEVDNDNLASTLATSLLTTTMDDGVSCSVDEPRTSTVYNTCKQDVSAIVDVGFGVSVPHPTSLKPPRIDEDDDVFLSPSSIPTSPIRSLKKKHRPEPLYIPPQVNTCGYQSRLRSPRLWDPTPSITGNTTGSCCVSGHGTGMGMPVGFSVKPSCSPPPYTPPPMLSPLRCGSGLFWHVLSASGSMTPKSTPLTPSRQGLAAMGGFPPSDPLLTTPLEEEEDIGEPPETDILPHVNVGPQFQARLPVCRPYGDRKYAPHVDDLIWDSNCEESLSDKEVENYLQFACCAALPGGGRNKEYALHVLQMVSGNIQEAMLRLMDPVPKLEKIHPLLDYNYSESDKWSADDIDSFQQALMTFDKDFFNISLEMKSKSVKQCVQFYYLWKKVCPDEYRRLRTLRRRREQDGLSCAIRGVKQEVIDADDHESNADLLSEKSGDFGVDRYVCEYPDCFATFLSRQALNGHVRIHGWNANASTNGSRSRSRSPTKYTDSQLDHNFGNTTTLTTATTLNDQFPCKICGKVFSKVKSRSAHMKSHRPIDPDKVK